MQLAFGRFLFDSARRSLERDGDQVDLTPKALRLLEILIERQPSAVPRHELIRLLWPDVVVVDGNLVNLIAEIRRRLDDGDPQKWIRTVRRFGYRFVGEGIRGQDPLLSRKFQITLGDRHFPLRAGSNRLGRGPDSVVPVSSRSVSRRHALIAIAGGRAVLQDLGSRNGTYVGGKRVHATTELRHGDTIVLGSELVGVFETLTEPDSTISERSPARV